MPSVYPINFDNDANLYLVHDELRTRLVEDYNPGDTVIYVDATSVFDRFPPTGIITLTEQCSDIGLRAISFEYTTKGTDWSFSGLTLLPGFTDVAKPKRITHVTQNVMAAHHNQLKDALIAIEEFVGVEGVVAPNALVGTMEARINFLRNLVLAPKAWFSATKKIGIAPLTVTFKDFSTRQPTKWSWDFGDASTDIINRTETILTGETTKTYYTPGIYDVTLTVENDFGTDTIVIPDMVTVRYEAPDEAVLDFLPTTSQAVIGGVLRSRSNQLIKMLISDDGSQVGDSIASFTWDITDDLQHAQSANTNAQYSIGGIYDVKVKAESQLGSYRITTFEDVIDIVEKFNIWHFIFDSSQSLSATTKTLYAYEFGLLSETYKAASVSSALTVTRDAGFLTGVPLEPQQYAEFRKNCGFSPRSYVSSGDKGAGLLYWAEGATTPSTQQKIRFREFNGFDNTWSVPVLSNSSDNVDRQWNWLALSSPSNLYFLLGSPGPGSFIGSPTNQSFKSVDLTTYGLDDIVFTSLNYLNGANELMTNVGAGSGGDFSVYRGTWQDSSGYFVRNDGTGLFFRLKSFYRTEGTQSAPIGTIRKLTDMPGATKFEGQMVSLSRGVYFFNNTGEATVYSPATNTWALVDPGSNSIEFARLQDSTVAGYDSAANRLVAISDGSSKAYLFYDYSTRAQLKFNETDLTFTSLPVRPSGEQFTAGLY